MDQVKKQVAEAVQRALQSAPFIDTLPSWEYDGVRSVPTVFISTPFVATIKISSATGMGPRYFEVRISEKL